SKRRRRSTGNNKARRRNLRLPPLHVTRVAWKTAEGCGRRAGDDSTESERGRWRSNELGCWKLTIPHTMCAESRSPRTLRQREREDQIAAAASAFTAARCDRDELLAVHHVDRRRGEHAAAGVELPQQLAALRVVREQIAGGVAAGADEDEPAGGDDRSCLSP